MWVCVGGGALIQKRVYLQMTRKRPESFLFCFLVRDGDLARALHPLHCSHQSWLIVILLEVALGFVNLMQVMQPHNTLILVGLKVPECSAASVYDPVAESRQ